MNADIEKDEWYPVFILDSRGTGAYEVPDDLVARYDALMVLFNAIQKELRVIRNN